MSEIQIKYVDTAKEAKELFYDGEPVDLRAEFIGDELASVDLSKYRFCWIIDKGKFADENIEIEFKTPNGVEKTYWLSISPGSRTRILTEDLVNDQIQVYVFAVTINQYRGFTRGGKDPLVELSKKAQKIYKLKQQGNVFVLEPLQEPTGYRAVPKGKFELASTSDFNTNFVQAMEQLNNTLSSSVSVGLRRTAIAPTDDLGLWVVIRKSTQAIGFNSYFRFMNSVLGSVDVPEPRRVHPPVQTPPWIRTETERTQIPNVAHTKTKLRYQQMGSAYRCLLGVRALPFNDTDAYRLLKVATEAFLLTNGGVNLNLDTFTFSDADIDDLRLRTSSGITDLDESWDRYLRSINGDSDPMLPYLALVSRKFGNEPLNNRLFPNLSMATTGFVEDTENCLDFLLNKLSQPFLVELIWSYWHEEGMLVQTLNAIARRFQNVRSPHSSRDPLANLEIDPLRGLNNLLWGYVQDEQHRLSLIRRVYEYDHHYGIALQGKAVPKLRPADSRSKFIEAFHNLLHVCSVFYKQDDDTTVNSDGFPILNALREVHLILSQGAHNQFGDLPSTARQEMLIQQWLLARPEFREFLPTRNMVAYPEAWMDRVDAMKSLQGWTDISIDHFNRLAVFGEQILLSIRFGAWSHITQSSPNAANWARFWRAEIQGYIHDYRAVTGVDLTSPAKVDSTPPSVHLFRRYLEQARR